MWKYGRRNPDIACEKIEALHHVKNKQMSIFLIVTGQIPSASVVDLEQFIPDPALQKVHTLSGSCLFRRKQYIKLKNKSRKCWQN
jgi:hypothetical protein